MVQGSVSIVMVGDFLVALGFFIVFLVFKENTHSAATIEVAADQKVISTGPSAPVRHPMYAGALVLLWHPARVWIRWGLIMFIPVTVVIVSRRSQKCSLLVFEGETSERAE